ncbi:MAG: outer membrane lipoprotein-sorting protein [bacterium]|nr:outer membrane lipoprotein-sorting protein [bacterium]
MKSKLLSLILILVTTFSQAQTVDEIVDSYIETIGGKSFLRNLEGIRLIGTFKQSGLEIPIEQVLMKDGRQYSIIKFNGMEFKQNVYDGKVLWGYEFGSTTPIKSDEEATYNIKLGFNDFPDALLDYKTKSYVVDLMGEVEKEGRKAYKIRVKKEDKIIDGQKWNDISYYYIDVAERVSICEESSIQTGPNAGQLTSLNMSEFESIDGKYLTPMNIKQASNGQTLFELVITKVELNPVVSQSDFNFPE